MRQKLQILQIAVCFLLIITFVATPMAAFADGWNLNVSKGYQERHAGINYSWNLYPKDRDGNPDWDHLARSSLTSMEPVWTRKCAAEIFVDVLNAGKNLNLNTEEVNIKMIVPYDKDRGGYIVDLDKVPGGINRFKVVATHEGGMASTQIVIFTLRNPYPITDENIFYFNVQDPYSPVTPEQDMAMRYSTGGVAYDGRDVNRDHKINIITPNQVNGQSVEDNNLTIQVWEDVEMTRPSFAPCQIKYGKDYMNAIGPVEVSGASSFSLPAGPVEIRCQSTQGKVHIVGNSHQFELLPGEKKIVNLIIVKQ